MKHCWEIILPGFHIAAHLLSKGTDKLVLDYFFRGICLANSHGRARDCPLLERRKAHLLYSINIWISLTQNSSPLMQLTDFVGVPWPSFHHFVGTEAQKTGTGKCWCSATFLALSNKCLVPDTGFHAFLQYTWNCSRLTC